MPVKDASDVVIELSKLNWELLDLGYRPEWDDAPTQEKAKKLAVESKELSEAMAKWRKRKLQYLDSITRRVKYEALLGRVVTKGHIGKVGFKSVYDMDPGAGLDVNYEVISTKPPGEVRVTEDTKLEITESDKSW